jgi:hypothetical protein
MSHSKLADMPSKLVSRIPCYALMSQCIFADYPTLFTILPRRGVLGSPLGKDEMNL